jgi:hypothetical protein
MGLHEGGLDGSLASLSRGVALVRRITSEYAEGDADNVRLTLMVDAMATVQGLCVHLDGKATDSVEEFVIPPELVEAIRSDPAALRQLIG